MQIEKTTILNTKPQIKASKPASAEKKALSQPYFSSLSSQILRNYTLAFGAKKYKDFEEDVVKKVKNKQFQGASLFDKVYGTRIDWDKVGWDNLKQEPINWEKATDKEVWTFWHALALAETNDTTWVKRYNPQNLNLPLATYHTSASDSAMRVFSDNLKEIKKSRKQALDTPIIDKKTGKLNFDFTVFDTETTGVRIYPVLSKNARFDGPKPLDKLFKLGR